MALLSCFKEKLKIYNFDIIESKFLNTKLLVTSKSSIRLYKLQKFTSNLSLLALSG